MIGFTIVSELIAAGHEVTGLARSDEGAKKLVEAGARVHKGTMEDQDCLRRGAAAADGVIHTAFYHRISHIPLSTRLRVLLGGSPSGIARRFMGAAADIDRRAIETLGAAIGKGSPLVATFGLALKRGVMATEDDPYDHDPAKFGFIRARGEDTLRGLVERGVRTSAVRLPPIVHGLRAFGLASAIIPAARKNKRSVYVGDGTHLWPSVHHKDAARLFRLALEHGQAGGTYHGVDEEGIPYREIATVIGRRLNVPVVSEPVEKAIKSFGIVGPMAVTINNPTSSKLTRERLGWEPTHIKLLPELEQSDILDAPEQAGR